MGSEHGGKKCGFYSTFGKKPLKGIEQQCNMIRFTFSKDSSGGCVENGLGEGTGQLGGQL